MAPGQLKNRVEPDSVRRQAHLVVLFRICLNSRTTANGAWRLTIVGLAVPASNRLVLTAGDGSGSKTLQHVRRRLLRVCTTAGSPNNISNKTEGSGTTTLVRPAVSPEESSAESTATAGSNTRSTAVRSSRVEMRTGGPASARARSARSTIESAGKRSDSSRPRSAVASQVVSSSDASGRSRPVSGGLDVGASLNRPRRSPSMESNKARDGWRCSSSCTMPPHDGAVHSTTATAAATHPSHNDDLAIRRPPWDRGKCGLEIGDYGLGFHCDSYPANRIRQPGTRNHQFTVRVLSAHPRFGPDSGHALFVTHVRVLACQTDQA